MITNRKIEHVGAIIRDLDDLIQALQKADDCREKAIALTHMETAQMWLNKFGGKQICEEVATRGAK